MANLIISAKSGRGWALKELVYFKIEIETVPALDFFKTAQLPAPTVPAAIMNNVDLPAGPLPHDARLFFGYLEDAMTGEESMVVDFSAFLLRLPDRLILCRKELSFEMCGSHVDAKADVCVVSQVGHHYLFLVQEDKRSIDAEPQLIAETIAAVYQNNRSRIVAGLPTLQQMVIPGITMRGATPIFFKIPITQDLITSVALGCRPEQSTVIHRCIPPVPRPATYVREGMKPLDNRRIVLQCLEAFKAFLGQQAAEPAIPAMNSVAGSRNPVVLPLKTHNKRVPFAASKGMGNPKGTPGYPPYCGKLVMQAQFGARSKHGPSTVQREAVHMWHRPASGSVANSQTMAMRKKSAGTRTSKRKTRKASPPPPSPPKTCPTTAPTRTISDLPNELLLKIFAFSIEQDPNNPHKPSRTARHTSQVCHRWRNVSLNWPGLWAASVDFGDPVLWIDEVIKRAVPSKITMVIPSVTESMMKNTVPEDAHLRPQVRLGDLLMRWDCTVQLETLLFQCIHHLSRCREVALKVPGQAWSRLNSFMQDLSNVESLTLVRIGSEFPRSPEELLFHAPIVVSDDPPPWKLRALDLRWCGTQFRSPAFYQLEELTVSDVPTDVAIGPDVWIDVLDRMRSLRRLELANATLTRAYYVESENEGLKHRLGPPINLPHLEWLKLEAPLHHINHLLSSIVVPAECELNLAGCGFSSLNPAFHSLLALVDSRKIGNKLQVALTADSFIIRSSGSGALPLELSLRWNEPPMLAVHDRPIDPQDLFSAATAALAKSCGSVTDLDLTFGVPIDGAKHGAILSKFLRPFTALQRLGGVSSSTFVFLLPFFQPSLQPEKPKDDGTYVSDLLPALESIWFVGIDFREPAGQGRSKYWALLSFIHCRSRKPAASSDNVEEDSPRPSPIFDVRLRSCFGMGEKQMESLESLGAQVLPRRFGRD